VPAEQSVQLTAPLEFEYFPVGQESQEDWPVPDWWVPAVHGAHEEPAVGEKLPVPQSTQAVRPAFASFPAAQLLHEGSPELEVVPAGHRAHETEPAMLVNPALQLKQTLEPAPDEYFPAGQLSHVERPDSG
jgi:hypothetical protein